MHIEIILFPEHIHTLDPTAFKKVRLTMLQPLFLSYIIIQNMIVLKTHVVTFCRSQFKL